MSRVHKHWLFIIGLLLFPQLPTNAAAQSFDHRALAVNTVDGHIRPVHQKLASAMRTLERSIADLCQSPSETNLKNSRSAFRKAVLARAAIEHLRFGPVTSQNRYERLAFWPDPKGIGRRQVRRALRRKKMGFDDPTALAKMSVALQGLTALEIVLYAKQSVTLAHANAEQPFRCGVAQAIAKNLKNISNSLHEQWVDDQGYARLMREPGPNNPVYLNPSEVTLDIIQSYISALGFVRDRKIDGPFGGEEGPRPRSVEYRLSQSARIAVKGNIIGLENLYRDGGLRSALSAVSADRVKRADKSFELAHAMIDAISQPLEEAVQDDAETDRIITLSLALSGARSAVGKGINQAAGLSLGFNAGDGD